MKNLIYALLPLQRGQRLGAHEASRVDMQSVFTVQKMADEMRSNFNRADPAAFRGLRRELPRRAKEQGEKVCWEGFTKVCLHITNGALHRSSSHWGKKII